IGLGAIGLDVLHGLEQRLLEVVAVGLPRADVAGVELEDTKAEVTGVRRVLVLDLLRGSAEALLGQLGDVARFAKLVAKSRSSCLVGIIGIERLWELNQYELPYAANLFCHLPHRMACRSASSVEVEDQSLRILCSHQSYCIRDGP